MFRRKQDSVEEALQDGERACIDRGCQIYDVLHSDELDIDQYLTLTSSEWQCLRMYAHKEHPGMRLDIVWSIHGDDEVYQVRLDWDISSVVQMDDK